MNESDFNQLKEKSWRSPLTAAEEVQLRAWLAQHPQSKEDWEAERRLTELMNRLPDAPLPSNFTARVLQAIDRETAADSRPRVSGWSRFLRLLLPRAAVAAVVLTVVLVGVTRQKNEAARQAEMVQGVKVVTGVPTLPSPEILQDFETIRKMSTTPGPDPELIALMK